MIIKPGVEVGLEEDDHLRRISMREEHQKKPAAPASDQDSVEIVDGARLHTDRYRWKNLESVQRPKSRTMGNKVNRCEG